MILHNEELKALLIEKGKLVDEGREITKKIEALEQKRNKQGLQIQKVKDKMIPLILSLNIPLGEYEGLGTIELRDGEIHLETINYMEQFLESWKNRDNQKEPGVVA